MAVRGWILDVYPCGPSDVAVWIVGEDGKRVRLVDRFTRKIYVYGDSEELEKLRKSLLEANLSEDADSQKNTQTSWRQR
jgi:hypothetical protein